MQPTAERPDATVPAQAAARPSIPWWGWVFAVMCALVPVIAMGGAIPGAIGFGGAGGCIAVSKSWKLSVAARVGICAAIAVASWVLFGVLVVWVAAFSAGQGHP